MPELTFNSGFESLVHEDNDVLSAFRPKAAKAEEIRQGMTPDELADVVSDRLIAVIKQQFEETEKKFQEKKK